MSLEIKPLLNDDFPSLAELYPWPTGFWMRANFVQSINGKVTDSSRNLYLSSKKDKSLFRYLRATADCLIIGRQTAISQPYKDVKISREYLPLRHTNNSLEVIIISNSLDFPSGFFADFRHKPFLITNRQALKKHPEILPLVDPIELGESTVDMNLLIAELTSRGFFRVLCEGGPALLTQLVNYDLLDEINLTISSSPKAFEEKSLFTNNLMLIKEDDFYFNQVLFDRENLFLRILRK